VGESLLDQTSPFLEKSIEIPSPLHKGDLKALTLDDALGDRADHRGAYTDPHRCLSPDRDGLSDMKNLLKGGIGRG